jgi:hypothetical protein
MWQYLVSAAICEWGYELCSGGRAALRVQQTISLPSRTARQLERNLVLSQLALNPDITQNAHFRRKKSAHLRYRLITSTRLDDRFACSLQPLRCSTKPHVNFCKCTALGGSLIAN